MSASAFRPSRTSLSLCGSINALSDVLGYASALLLLGMLLMICYDVVMRYAFDSPTTWSTEISTYVLVAITFLGAAHTHRKNGHIRVELLLMALKPPRREQIELVAAWCGIIFLSVATWQTGIKVASDYVHGTRAFSLLLTPIFLPEIPIPIGLFAFTLAMLVEAYRLRRPASPRHQAGVVVVIIVVGLILWRFGLRPPRIGNTGWEWGSPVLAAGWVIACGLWSGWRTTLQVIGLLGGIALALLFTRDWNVPVVVAILALATLVFLLAGIRISLALGLIGLVGTYVMLPFPQPFAVAERAWSSINSFELTAVPMFVLMGTLLLRSGVVDMVFDTLSKWGGRIPGALAHSGIAACAIFAAVSGSSVATAATMGLVACPAMVRRGYSPRLTYGSIAAGGTLGILIPPSIAMIIYGSTVGASVAALFIAGVIPGLALTAAFMSVVLVWSWLYPGSTPRSEPTSWREKLSAVPSLLPVTAMIVGVLGSLYAGIATPTEAGALGAMASLLICIGRRRLTPKLFVEILIDTVRVSTFLFLIIVGASTMTYLFDYLRLPQLLVQGVQQGGFSPTLVMLLISLLYIVLGMFIDTISMMVMTLPVLFPLIVSVGFDPIWFGVVLVILMEIGLITPPVGMNLFVLKGLSGDVALKEIIYGVMPFMLVMILSLVLLYLFPEIATWLPTRMFPTHGG